MFALLRSPRSAILPCILRNLPRVGYIPESSGNSFSDRILRSEKPRLSADHWPEQQISIAPVNAKREEIKKKVRSGQDLNFSIRLLSYDSECRLQPIMGYARMFFERVMHAWGG